MNVSDFDAWRENYGNMSYADQQDFYDRVYADHPDQAGYVLHGGLELFSHFFERVLSELPKVYVLELGGWRGELANEMLNRFPSLSIWCNVEICRAAVRGTVFASPRYTTWIPPDHPWNVELPPANVVVASHFIEHIKRHELDLLLINLPATLRYLVSVAPLPEVERPDWNSYHGSHILEASWDEVAQMLDTLPDYIGFELVDDLSQKDFKVFKRT